MKRPRRFTLLALMSLAVLAVLILRSATGGRPALGDPVAWAQESSCGNAIIDPGEECDPPGSLTCPPGSATGSFACGSDCTCPTEEVLDHFQCYAVKRRSFPNQSVTVTHQFGTLDEEV